jgi:hypothetical protein
LQEIKQQMSQILKNSKVVEESVILRDDIQNRINKQEEEKKLSDIKPKFMTETTLIQNT